MMKLQISFSLGFASTILFISAALNAQEKSAAAEKAPVSYELNRETTLIGTVLYFARSSSTPPLGPHLSLQTSFGVVDVHLGDARLLAANHFDISPGDNLRIIGETLAYGSGTQFVARILQKGSQALTVRSIRGIPVSYGKIPSSNIAKRGISQ